MISNKEKSDNKLAMAHARFAAFTKSTAKQQQQITELMKLVIFFSLGKM